MRWFLVVMVLGGAARAERFVGNIGAGWEVFQPQGSFIGTTGTTAQTFGPSLELGWRVRPELDVVLELVGTFSDTPLTLSTLVAPALRYRADDNFYLGTALGLGTALVHSSDPGANSDASATENGIELEVLARYVFSSRPGGHGFAITARCGATLFSHEQFERMSSALTFGVEIGFHW